MDLSKKQLYSLYVAMGIALLGLFIFLKGYFSVIALAAIVAYISNPFYLWLTNKTGRKTFALWTTFFLTIVAILVPTAIILTVTINQTFQIIEIIKTSNHDANSVGSYLDNIVHAINRLISNFPGAEPVTAGQLSEWFKERVGDITTSVANYLISFAGSFMALIAKVVIYVYVYLSLIRNQDKILETIHKLNPLGGGSTTLYLGRMGAMTKAMVKGQFTIAIVQGLISATLIKIAGLDFFIFWFVMTTFLSIIPLGSGVAVYPIALYMLATGQVWQFVFLVASHILIVTNIDNVLRPKFVPKKAMLDPALTMLSVFAGIAMFGFLGIIIGPVFMIMITTTVQVYIAAVDKKAEQDLKKASEV